MYTDGPDDGRLVTVGAAEIVGERDGGCEGRGVGLLVGPAVGEGVGPVGSKDTDGLCEGPAVTVGGNEMVGVFVGISVGLPVGVFVGLSVGEAVGFPVGLSEPVGEAVGFAVGEAVGSVVASMRVVFVFWPGSMTPSGKGRLNLCQVSLV